MERRKKVSDKSFEEQLQEIKDNALQLGRLRLCNELVKAVETKEFSRALTLFHGMPPGEGSNLVFMAFLSGLIKEIAE